ncbi:MAG: hypothetical protein CMB65_02960 [Euryarchaeota archaeon]|nr:hypothetical protein [Euryarchaeota archaeon]
MATEKNPFNAWFFFSMPIFIFVAIYQLIPAISERLVPDLMGQAIYFGIAVIIGIFLFRNSRTVRDHEWHRQRQIKSLQKDYAAEDRGVWSKADLAMSELEADARSMESGQMSRKALERLDGSIAGLTSERLTTEIERADEEQGNIALFSESEHVRRSTSRVTGESGPVESVTGVTHAQMEPDKSLIGGVLDRIKETSTATPTVAESPVAQALSKESDDWYTQEMKGVSTVGSTTAETNSPGNICPSCGWNNPESVAYCENCGDKL